jgi:glutathione peroxidase
MTTAIQDIPVQDIRGEPSSLNDYRGKVLLVVNVASKCGLTPQYEGLEKLYRDKHSRGLEVLGFPANDFAGQEPGSEAEIADFCRTTYDVTFPMFAKIAVTGANTHPLYRELIKAQPSAQGDAEGFREKLVGYGIEPNPAPGVLWNFEKFLVARDGRVVARFAPSVAPDDPALVKRVDAELARS